MERLYASYKGHVEFLIVYIREAHPEMLKEGHKTGIVGRPDNINERVILATECVSQFKFTMPMVIDGMDGKVNSDYQAAPVRVTITDIDGKVAFYAGRGPFDFRLPPVERTIKKLIANEGHMPPPPKPEWSQSVNGLRCGLSFDPDRLTIGEQVVAQLKFENTSDEPIAFYHKVEGAADRFVIANDSGQTLKMQAARGNRFSRMRRGRSSPVRMIAPGKTFETQVEGKVVAASVGDDSIAGQFHAVYNVDMGEQSLAGLQPAPTQTVWTGKVSSGAYTVSVTSPEKEGCVDCHGGADYHHVKVQECTNCHVGEVGKADFGLKVEACATCHPRTGVFGRRTILGSEGEFGMASKHIAGTIEDSDCLKCHDHSNHRNGVVSLIDPDSEGKEPWTGSRTDFCLACHDGEPPDGVTFPETPAGSGFDKMMFLGSKLAQTKEGCSYCHMPHGSPYPALLRNLHTH
jgi:hypothetical protein